MMTRTLALALAAFAAACGGDGTGPSGDALDDASAAAIVGLPLSAGALPANSLVTPLGVAAPPAPVCRYQEGGGRYECDPVTSDGVTLTRSYAFLDAAGRPQRRFDPVATASINTRFHIAGTTTRTGPAFTIDRRGDMTVSGLQGAETTQIINGVESGTTTVTGSTGFGRIATSTTSNDTTLNLVVPIPPRPPAPPAPGERPAPIWPLSGKRISNQTGSSSLDGGTSISRDMRQVITYNGTSVVTIEATIDGTTRTCQIDLLQPGFGACLLGVFPPG